MLLSIIIVNWNVRDLLRECIRSVRREMLVEPGNYELIVIDNASADGSVEMLRQEFPDVALIESDVNLGFGAGCNRAFKLARGSFVLLLNPDTRVIDHAVDGLLGIMIERTDAAVIAPRLVYEDLSFQRAAGGALPTLANVMANYLFVNEILPRRLRPPALFLEGDPQGLINLGWVSGASMLLRRESLGDFVFDEAFFMFGEDMDLCARLRDEGWSVLYTSRHSIIHHHGKSFDQQGSLEIRAAAHLGPRRVFAKSHDRLSVWLYDAILLTGFAVRWLLYSLLAGLRPEQGYEARASFSRNYVRSMLLREKR